MCQLTGEDGNIFNLTSIASKALKKYGMKEQSKEMINKVFKAESYEEALMIIDEYVEVI